MPTRPTLAALVGLAALTLGACTDQPGTTAPAAPDLARGRPDHNPTGAVYVQTNDASKNEIVVLRRAADGQLAAVHTFPTGGRGTGMPRLGSQGSVILSDDNRWLFVANVGSNEISAFAVTGRGLALVDKVASGGTMPFSLTLRGELLYVLNAGGSGNITAFTVSRRGKLTPLAESTRPLSGSVTGSTTAPAPAQVQFSPDGRTLVVTEKATNIIDTYTVDASGYATGPVVHPSHGQTPFGFDFTDRGVFVVTEAFNATPGAAAASSYSLAGGFQLLSGSVKDTQTDVCWTVITRDNNYAYVTNFGSGTISSYRVGVGGRIELEQAVAARTAQAEGPRDQDLTNSGQYLYVLDIGFADPSTQAVNAFEVQADGRLRKIGAYALREFYPAVAGLAAR